MRDPKPYVALLFVQISFASLPVAGKIALEGLPPLALAGLRVFFASLFLAAVALSRAPQRVERKDLFVLMGLSLLGIVLNQLMFLEGLAHTTAVNANVLVATIPVFTTAIAILARQERARTARLVGIATSLVGVLVVLNVRRFDAADQYLLGNSLVIGNCLVYSCYLVFSRDLLRKYASSTVVLWTFLFGAVALFPFGVASLTANGLAGIPARSWWALAFIVAVPSVLAYSLNNYALQRVRSSTVASFIFLQPLMGVALALLILHGESVGARVAVGGSLILLGLVVVSRTEAVEPVAVIPESGEAMSRQPLVRPRAGAQPEPQEDDPRGRRQEAP